MDARGPGFGALFLLGAGGLALMVAVALYAQLWR